MKTARGALVLVVVLTGLAAAPSEAGYVVGGRTIWSIAGTGVACEDAASDCGDGPSAIDAFLSSPGGIAVAGDGTVFIADTGDQKIRRVTTSGAISTIAGTGEPCPVASAACGDGGPGVQARLNEPRGLALTADGTLLIADSGNHRIRALAPDGKIRALAGAGDVCGNPQAPCGDDGPGAGAAFDTPSGVAVDGGDVLIADTGDRRVRRVRDGVITTIAGTGAGCVPGCGDGGPASAATFGAPAALAVGAGGDVVIADSTAQRVRRIDTADGRITTIAGNGTACAGPTQACGDGGAPSAGQLGTPLGVAVDGDAVLIADSATNRIRRAGATLTTVAGTGEACARPPACGDGGAASLATLSTPQALAVGDDGDVFVADSEAHLVRWLAGPGGGVAPPDPATPDPAPAADDGRSAVESAPAAAKRAKTRATIVRCVGRRCRVAGTDPSVAAKLRGRTSETRGGAWARVELRRGGRRWAYGAGRTLARALTLLPDRTLRAGRYRLRITQRDADGQRRRDRIVRLR